jgi:hypothetical protein
VKANTRDLVSLGFEAHRSVLLLRIKWHNSPRSRRLRTLRHTRVTSATSGRWSEMESIGAEA